MEEVSCFLAKDEDECEPDEESMLRVRPSLAFLLTPSFFVSVFPRGIASVQASYRALQSAYPKVDSGVSAGRHDSREEDDGND